MIVDWLIALWVAASGVGFVVCEIARWGEPVWGRYVYAALVTVCLVGLALRAVRRVLVKRDNEA